MAASGNESTLCFFEKATAKQWSFLLGHYKDILRLHAHKTRSVRKNGPEELIKLDNWFHDTLPAAIQGRKDKHVTHEELVQITKWKMTRGKNRRQILDLVRINTELAVKQTTQKAFRKIPNLAGAIGALTNLKGVGPQTASAVLAAGFPEHCPYMADECMLSIPGVESTDCTMNEFNTYSTAIKACVERLQEQDPETKWNPHKVEMALWVHYVAKELKPSLLENMPNADGSKRATAGNNSELDEDISNTSDNDIVSGSESRNGNGNSNTNGRHSSALDEDSNISVPASTGSASGDDSKLSNGDEDSRQSGEFRTPLAAANNSSNNSGSNNHHHHMSSNSNESSAESLSNNSEPASNSSSVADETSQGSASVPTNGDALSPQKTAIVVPAVTATVPCAMSLVHEAEDANHVVPNSCGSALPLSPASLEEPALKKIRASE